jgi:integrase
MPSTNTKMPAWNLLAEQPESLAGMTAEQRNAIVISAVTLSDGTSKVISRFGDQVWKLDAYIIGAGAMESAKRIEWPEDCDQAIVDALKAVCFAWKHRGRNELAPPQWQTIRVCAVAGIPFVRWLRDHGINSLSLVRPLHLANYVHHCKNELQLEPGGVRHRLGVVDLLWRFRSDVQDGLGFQPWDGRSITAISGSVNSFETARTPIIPRPVQEQLFNHSVQVLEEAERSVGRAVGILVDPVTLIAAEALNIRDAMLYIVSITTGMRNDEILSAEVGCYREETISGIVYRWIRSTESKTGKGVVEYLCPEIAGRAVRVLEAWRLPYRALLDKAIEKLLNEPESADRELRLRKANADLHRLFLCVAPSKGWRVTALTSESSRNALIRLAKSAGVEWNIHPHQTRRTYARMVVESRMGRTSLIFLKWQLKHTSMTMSQGYASNPVADRSLFEDYLDEMNLYRGELLDSWTLDTPLSGGAGRSITQLRATAHPNREALLKSASEHVHIRATGHGWCIAETQGCGGAGLYEATRCVDCKEGVIDPSFAETWLEIHSQQQELLELQDVGPAVKARAQRELRLSTKVLNDLGIQVMAWKT